MWALRALVESYFDTSLAILSLGGHLGASEALLEPDWSKTDLLTHRGETLQKLRVTGRKPSPKGRG
eukprot:7941153-Pyramimonas_sp.AAC.1